MRRIHDKILIPSYQWIEMIENRGRRGQSRQRNDRGSVSV
jgi:hypothetical protein